MSSIYIESKDINIERVRLYMRGENPFTVLKIKRSWDKTKVSETICPSLSIYVISLLVQLFFTDDNAVIVDL